MPEGPIVDALGPAGWAEGQARKRAELSKRPGVLIDPAFIPMRPALAAPTISTDWYIAVTSGTMNHVWRGDTPSLSRAGLWVSVPWRTGATTTGELLVYEDEFGQTTATVTLPAGSAGIRIFKWEHGIGLHIPEEIYVRARRATGANNVEIGLPSVAMVPPVQFTETGV